jgi:hypothetical protein
MNPGELDSLLERAAELAPLEKLPTDPLELRRWTEQAWGLLVELRQTLRDGVASNGGTLALRIREALEEKIVKLVNGRAELTAAVQEHSVQVALLPDVVIVDVRMRVGKAKEDGTAPISGSETD